MSESSPIVAVLQARFSSRRLPGKVMRPILGEPMLYRQIERILRVRQIDRLVVATSTDATDDPIARMAEAKGVACFRGSLDDVLDRFYQAALPYRPIHVVRLTGDCPLADPAVIDAAIAFHLESGKDYTSNALEPTFPDGLDVEVMRFAALESAWREAKLPSQREHVTPFIYQHPENFAIGHFSQPENLSQLRWTVDEPEDFDLVTAVFEHLYPQKPDFGMRDVLAFLDANPALGNRNSRFRRNEGYDQSLAADAAAAQQNSTIQTSLEATP